MRTPRLLLVVALFAALVAGATGAEAKKKPAIPFSACSPAAPLKDQPGRTYKLTQNLNCTDNGVDILADNITIDLNGFTLTGDNDVGSCGVCATNRSGVKVRNGVVSTFERGIWIAGQGATPRPHVLTKVITLDSAQYGIEIDAGGNRAILDRVRSASNGAGVFGYGGAFVIKRSSIEDNGNRGISISGDAVISKVLAHGNGLEGMVVIGTKAVITKSTASGNGQSATGYDGILVQSDSASLVANQAHGNGGNGILVSGDGAVLKKNRADGNGYQVLADGEGFGVKVSFVTVPPKGTTNTAFGTEENGECTPDQLCGGD